MEFSAYRTALPQLQAELKKAFAEEKKKGK